MDHDYEKFEEALDEVDRALDDLADSDEDIDERLCFLRARITHLDDQLEAHIRDEKKRS